MKGLLTSLFIVVLCTSMNAQWSIGPRVSIGTITQKAETIRINPNGDTRPIGLSFNGGSSVQSLGFMAHNEIGPCFLQIEALGTKYDLQFSSTLGYRSDADPITHNETNFIIEIPVAAGVTVKNVKIGVGPVLEIKADKETELSALQGYEDTSGKFEGGFQGLVGYKKGIFHLDLRYVYRFNGIVDGFAIGNDQLKLNKSANRVALALGIAF